jgi:hypothetical protein
VEGYSVSVMELSSSPFCSYLTEIITPLSWALTIWHWYVKYSDNFKSNPWVRYYQHTMQARKQTHWDSVSSLRPYS